MSANGVPVRGGAESQAQHDCQLAAWEAVPYNTSKFGLAHRHCSRSRKVWLGGHGVESPNHLQGDTSSFHTRNCITL
jgi:hypothetical protein